MLIRSKYMVLSMLLIAVLSINTAFDMDLYDAHPKKRIDRNPALSQPYTSLKTTQSSPSIDVSEPAVRFDNALLVLRHYQQKVDIALKQQTRLTLSITPLVKHIFTYLCTKILSHRQTASFSI